MIIIIKLIEGDILNATEDVICHSVNCKAKMGSGLAVQIKEAYPEVFGYYKSFCDMRLPVDKMLGVAQYIMCHDGRYIVNIFGQDGYGREKGKQYTQIDALKKGLTSVYERAKQHNETVAIPWKIGSDRGGANWNEVYKMIEEIFHDYDVTLYKYNK